jgi:arsenite oxidase large subunit
LRETGDGAHADKFKGFDWKTEEDAFMDGYHKHEKGGEFVTYARLRVMGTNGFQEPAVGTETTGPVAGGTSTKAPSPEAARGKEPVQKDVPSKAAAPAASGADRIVGTKRLYADGKFNAPDGKATFMEAKWRGLQAPGKEEQKNKFKYLVNNGRTNHVWQNAYLDQDNEFVMDRWPYPFIEINPDDMRELNVAAGDLVEVYNDDGSTQAMVYPTPTAKKGQTFMQFAYPTGVQGNVVNAGTNELIIPNYKQTWANIRKLAAAPETVKHLTFKAQEYKAG